MYKPGSDRMPRFVRRSLLQGNQIKHIGMLCRSHTIPLAGLMRRARGLFLLTEAIFTIIFYASIKMITDIYIFTEDLLL